MKKSKIALNKKLVLVKDQVVSLDDRQAGDVLGGATVTCTIQTVAVNCNPVTRLCPPLSRIIACVTSPVTLGCNVCH